MKFITEQIKKRGYEITKPGYSDKVSVTYRKILKQFNIDHILDVGANEGQFAQSMRKLGYENKINSFEPLSGAFEKLSKNASSDRDWHVSNFALGNNDEQVEINISKNSVSSSLLEILPEHVKHQADSVIVGKEIIEVKKLDTVWQEMSISSSNVFLKLDVQGYEKNVLEGARDSLKRIKIVQLEMALVPLYKGEELLADLIRHMDSLGYVLYNLINGFNNFETGQLFQADGIFVRSDLIH